MGVYGLLRLSPLHLSRGHVTCAVGLLHLSPQQSNASYSADRQAS